MHTGFWKDATLRLWDGVLIAVPLVLASALAFAKAWPEKLVDKRFKRQLAEIDAKHAEALEGIKHQHQAELEKLRSEIQRLYSRISKIHEKEFEVLPKAWLLLHEAHGAAFNLISRWRNTYALEAMPEEALEEHMNSLEFSDAQKQQLRGATDKQNAYRMIRESQLLLDADKRQQKLTNYLIEHQIFMDDELRTAFDVVNKSLIHAVTLYDTGKAFDAKMVAEASQELQALATKIPDVEKAVQKRLRYFDA